MEFLVRFLHQTTTSSITHSCNIGCISSVSYIKPQRCESFLMLKYVVYRPFPTSNHNSPVEYHWPISLYIVRFLHQTTTIKLKTVGRFGCISSVSYIKPQLYFSYYWLNRVVYRPFPTSNHNWCYWFPRWWQVVYRPFPTSNHNSWFHEYLLANVVYRPFPTSNHNRRMIITKS